MANKHTEDFKQEAVRIDLSSRLEHRAFNLQHIRRA